MKKLPFFLVFLLLTSCAGLMLQQALRIPEDKLEIKNDSFKGTKTVTLEMWFNSEETVSAMGMTVPVSRLMGTFYKEVKKGNIDQKLNLKIFADHTKDSLKNEAFMKVNDKNIKVTVSNIVIENRTDIKATKSGYDSDAKITDIRTNKYKIMKGEIQLPGTIFNAVTNTSQVVIRLYLGDKPVTYTIASERMSKVIEYNNVK